MHSQYTELMSLALDNEADAGQMNVLQTHLKDCPECAAVWRRWQTMDAHLRAAPMLAPPPYLAAQVLARLAARRQRRPWGRWLGVSLLVMWLTAGSLILLAALGGFWWGLNNPVLGSLALSAGAQLLSSLLWPVRSIGIILASAGLSLRVGAALCVGLTCCLAGVWAWLFFMRGALVSRRGALATLQTLGGF